MFLNKSDLATVLEVAMASSCDFAEIFLEDTWQSQIRMIDDKIDTALDGRTYGAGIRIIKGLNYIYVTTNDLSLDGLVSCAKKASAAMGEGAATKKDIHLTDVVFSDIHNIKRQSSGVPLKEKAALIRSAYAKLKGHSKEIVQASAGLLEREQNVLIVNSDGVYAKDRRVYTRAALTAIASDGKETQIGNNSPGAMKGFEAYSEGINLEEQATEAAKSAIISLHAKNCPGGKMMVAVENAFGGAIFHEACGHLLESSSVSKGNSVFSGKLGQKIAGEKVNAVDDGTMPNEWGSINIDDEGSPSRKNVLIENGILKGYMIDKLGALRMGTSPTSSSRRESYQYAPTSRMTNTFILNGPDEEADIIGSMDYGLYAKKMGGGSVNTETGEFNFSVSEGYIVRKGQICEAVRGATLIGKGSEVLQNIDMVGKNLKLAQGVCGAASGSVFTTVGQPLIRVAELTVGGR